MIEVGTMYVVSGVLPFPRAMLKADNSFPVSDAMSKLLDGPDGEATTITLIGANAPDYGKWASFGWKVISSLSL